jgi:amino acid adenylation domain-containing protein
MSILFESKKYVEDDYSNVLNKYNYNWTKVKCAAIIMKRSPELLYLLYNLFNEGIAFIPIDPSYPIDRIEYILNEAQPDIVISDTSININYKKTVSLEIKNTAYILYTSGTTGKPKGIKVSKASLINFFNGISEIIDFSPKKQIACLTTVSFDIFFLESLMALYKGLTIVLANEDEQRNPRLMTNLLLNNNVDMIQMTPSRMQLLLNHDKDLSSLKKISEIMIGGESFPFCLLKALQEKTNAKIYNMYGPTEATIWSTVSDLTKKNYIDIGKPIKNTEIYIVDEKLNLLSTEQVGEICIAGQGLANGYIESEDLTAEKFVRLPQNPDIKVYRTGDIGKKLSNGNFEYLGRNDNQIKIRGHRIELEEIEAHLNQYSGIKQSVVIASGINETDRVLQVFYTSDKNIDSQSIREYLSSKLPSYMIPVMYKRIDEFIQTINGKIDRKRVLECIEVNKSQSNQEREFDDLTKIQKEALDVIITNLEGKFLNNIALDMDFGNIGLDSITFIKIVVALEGQFDFEFDDEMLLITKFPTIRSIIEYVDSRTNRNDKNT